MPWGGLLYFQLGVGWCSYDASTAFPILLLRYPLLLVFPTFLTVPAVVGFPVVASQLLLVYLQLLVILLSWMSPCCCCMGLKLNIFDYRNTNIGQAFFLLPNYRLAELGNKYRWPVPEF